LENEKDRRMKISAGHTLEELKENLSDETELADESVTFYPENQEICCLGEYSGVSYKYRPETQEVSQVTILDMGNWSEKKIYEKICRDDWNKLVEYAQENKDLGKS
jgi:hypothetical protein